jgi:transmembrane sensor
MTSDSHMNKEAALSDAIRERAIHWVLRQRDGDMLASDWVAFTEWLEADPQHLHAYDLALAADDDLGVIGPDMVHGEVSEEDGAAANDNKPGGLFARWPAFGAVAVMLLAAILFWPNSNQPHYVALQTDVGEIREVALSPSVSMVVNGNSRLELDKESATVRMLRGEATYRVNSAEPGALRVEVDDLVLIDYGTIFNVVRDRDQLRVAVIEGAVMIDPDDRKILVKAGQEIDMQLPDGALSRSRISPEEALAWQDKQLLFEDRSVASVIGDVERNFGTSISVANNLTGQKITGVISLTNGEATVINDVAAVLGSSAHKTETGWRIGD